MALDIFKITGPVRLNGEVTISGSKNAALPIMAATILAGGKNTLLGIPNLSDISVMCKLMEMSLRFGMPCKVFFPAARIVAAIIGRAAFFEPLIVTVPFNLTGPVILNISRAI